jgi:hypothetical protein
MRLRLLSLAILIFGLALGWGLGSLILAGPAYAFEVADQIKDFANYGIVGSLCIIMGWILWWKEKEKAKMVKGWDEERSKLNADRLVDYKDMAATLSSVRTGLSEWTAANVERNATVVALGQAITALGATIQLHTAAIDRQTVLIERASQSNRELRETLIASGVRP